MDRWRAILLCAWVLWWYGHIPPRDGPRPIIGAQAWHPIGSYHLREACEANEHGYRKRDPNSRYVCLPDTVNPRGR